ncbi:MAG: dihydrofolate reductase family protein [Streptosporangiaceae bacterium]
MISEDYAYPAGPWLRANMVSSVDGAATGEGGVTADLGNAADRELFLRLRDLAEVVLVGAGTVRAEGYGPVAGGTLAIVSRSLDLDFGSTAFTEATARTIVITVAAADRLEEARAHADVIVAGETAVDFAVAVAELHSRGLTKILCEGGPVILAQVAAAGLLDELCLTVSPRLLGGAAPRILHGLPVDVALTLAAVRHEDDHLFLRYTR